MKVCNLKEVLAHPVSKRLAVVAPISVGIGLLRAWLGEYSMLIGLLVGVGSYIFADWLFSTKSERQARIQQTAVFFRAHRWTATKWGMYILMCVYFFGFRSEPAEPAVKQILLLVQTFGLFAVFIVPAAISTVNAAIWGSLSSVAGLASRFLSGLAFYSMALWLIGHSGDALYGWVLAKPNDAAIGAAAFVIVWMVIHFSSGPSYGSESIARSSGAVAMTAGVIAPKPTARDNRYTAAHEAGHALVYAALGRLPYDVKAAVNDLADHNGALGFVTGIKSQHRLDEKTFAEWYMLVFLAGKMGEARMMGESTLGSTNDHTRWLNVAKQYLSNHYRGMFYPEPQNEFEQKLNEEKLSALQADQLGTLSRLFDQNADVFKELADALLEKRTLARDELIPFLARVELPEGFPLPFGPFEALATEWRDADDSTEAAA